ncbi:hypothetical protein SAMN05444004_10742 [Jannaschia faecimaris]|uniref:Uncharacterized protein n=1 Tax=Jannaschia faecimaris TaxID=1244108 RepID=A0A1H3QVH5_9RHOB|nr:hypothetical protein SAMN05444004_10742 [Jannaschia faecimaris]
MTVRAALIWPPIKRSIRYTSGGLGSSRQPLAFGVGRVTPNMRKRARAQIKERRRAELVVRFSPVALSEGWGLRTVWLVHMPNAHSGSGPVACLGGEDDQTIGHEISQFQADPVTGAVSTFSAAQKTWRTEAVILGPMGPALRQAYRHPRTRSGGLNCRAGQTIGVGPIEKGAEAEKRRTIGQVHIQASAVGRIRAACHPDHAQARPQVS